MREVKGYKLDVFPETTTKKKKELKNCVYLHSGKYKISKG